MVGLYGAVFSARLSSGFFLSFFLSFCLSRSLTSLPTFPFLIQTHDVIYNTTPTDILANQPAIPPNKLSQYPAILFERSRYPSKFDGGGGHGCLFFAPSTTKQLHTYILHFI